MSEERKVWIVEWEGKFGTNYNYFLSKENADKRAAEIEAAFRLATGTTEKVTVEWGLLYE